MPPPQVDRQTERPPAGAGGPKRVDLHCHSDASNKTLEAALNAINCPECYSAPDEVYAQAKRRGMDFVTITDHDTVCGVQRIAGRSDVLVGEELTCWFPEDDCKMHVLVYGITPEDHDELQRRANDIYSVAEYVERNKIAHAVAHPIYRQNDKLERWHLERLILLFKGFECLNGAHSPLHREAFEPVLNRLTRQEIAKLSERHGLLPRWPEPWFKARTAGSDDHGLLNIGRTWTEFPPETRTVDGVLQALREGACQPGGEAGSSAKLAHTFYSVAVRYYTRHIMRPGATPNLPTMILQTIAGERPAPSRTQIAGMVLRGRVKRAKDKLFGAVKSILPRPSTLGRGRGRGADASDNASGTGGTLSPALSLGYKGEGGHRSAIPGVVGDGHIGTGILRSLFIASAKQNLAKHPELFAAAEKGLPPLGEHEEMFAFVNAINRDVSRGVVDAMFRSVDDASFTGLFDSIAAVLAQQFVLFPYYFALFHQNKERHLLRQITGRPEIKNPESMKVALFTDTLDEVNGVARFVRDMAGQAQALGRGFTVMTCATGVEHDLPNRKNFVPLLTKRMPLYEELPLNVPPVLEVLEWADRQQFDAVHVSTPGPMGLCGWLVSKMLRIPLLGTYHTDFPAYMNHLTRDHRVTNGCVGYMKWLYGQMPAVYSRSKAYTFNLHDLGLPDERLRTLPPAVDTQTFNPQRRDDDVWTRHAVAKPLKLLYAGRVSVEKNLPMLVDVFKRLCAKRDDVALVVAGDGPYLSTMRGLLAGCPAHFLGYQDDAQLPPLYAGADLLVFPSRTDTLGQVVMEAQACGLPAVVGNEGGPKETVADGLSGLVLTSNDPGKWADAIHDLLNDQPRRHRMAYHAPARVARFTLANTFEAFWRGHAEAVMPNAADDELPAVPPGARVHA